MALDGLTAGRDREARARDRRAGGLPAQRGFDGGRARTCCQSLARAWRPLVQRQFPGLTDEILAEAPVATLRDEAEAGTLVDAPRR